MTHGTRAGYLRGCRCEDCADAHYRYTKAYKHRVKADPQSGVPARPVRVPSGPVREHIAALRASGWTLAMIEREAPTSKSQAAHLARGDYPSVRRDIAARILALEPLTPVDMDEVVVNRLVIGEDWRRIRANRAERLAAFAQATAAGESRRSASMRLGIRSDDIAAMGKSA